jgi:hypothetical protein
MDFFLGEELSVCREYVSSMQSVLTTFVLVLKCVFVPNCSQDTDVTITFKILIKVTKALKLMSDKFALHQDLAIKYSISKLGAEHSDGH